jgi:elongation factor Ts
MTQVTAAQVKELREVTGAGMMDCKKALQENEGDIQASQDWLRTKGLAAAAKKAGRIAADGLIAVICDGKSGAVVEVNAETDFVARNEQFQNFAAAVSSIALTAGSDIEDIKAADYPESGRNVADELVQMISTIGENMSLRRAGVLATDEGVVSSYVHAAIAPGLGKIGVIVALSSTGDSEKLAGLGKQFAMHIAASAPQSVSVADLDPDAVARERAVLTEQAKESGKTDEIIDKMVEGRLRKFYQDVVLGEQTWVIDGETRVSKILSQAAEDIGAPISVAGFVRFALGEGIEKEKEDFAAEVAAQVQK